MSRQIKNTDINNKKNKWYVATEYVGIYIDKCKRYIVISIKQGNGLGINYLRVWSVLSTFQSYPNDGKVMIKAVCNEITKSY